MSLRKTLREHIAACFSGLWIQSYEHADAVTEIAQLCRDENWHWPSGTCPKTKRCK